MSKLLWPEIPYYVLQSFSSREVWEHWQRPAFCRRLSRANDYGDIPTGRQRRDLNGEANGEAHYKKNHKIQ